MNESHLARLAHAIPKEERKRILMGLKETDLHLSLKELFKRLEPDYIVEITHGADELGKDLVIVREDKFVIEAIGVVVKIGDIRATTLGEVDELKRRAEKIIKSKTKPDRRLAEIKSQVAQAVAHPATLKTLFTQIKVNKVYIVLAGDISSQARERLSSELLSGIVIYDINWLIDNFSEHYPQVFFEGIAIDFLYELIAGLEKDHMQFKRNKNLSDYFVEPLVTESELPLELDEKSLAIILKKKKIPFLHLRSILQQKRRILIIGEPGCGKSAALAKLAIDEYKTILSSITGRVPKKKSDIPLLIKAKDFVEIESGKTIQERYLAKNELKDRFNICALFVDALDEAPPTDRNKIFENIKRVSEELSCAVLITSRKIDLIETSLIGFDRFELMPFEFGQAIKLVGKLFNNRALINAIRDGLQKIKHEIPFFPLSLMLIIDLVEENKEIPASLTELYDRFFDFILGRYDRDKGIEVLFEYLIKKKFLSSLAYKEYFEKGRLEITREDFDIFLRSFSELYAWDLDKTRGFIREIERAGVISLKDAVIFRHRSFLDYFIGYYIYDNRDEVNNLKETITNIYFNEIWSEVAFFYIGLKREINEDILDRIFLYDKEQSLSILALKYITGRLLQAGWNTPTKIKRFGIEKGITYTEQIRSRLLRLIEKNRAIPKIVPDIVLAGLAELSYGSGLILNETKAILDKLIEKGDDNSVRVIIPLLSAIGRFLTEEEIETKVEKIMDVSKKLPPSDEASALVFLLLLKTKDKPIEKAIRRRLRYLANKHKNVLSGFLPLRRKGFR